MANDKKHQDGGHDQAGGNQGGGPAALKSPVDPATTQNEEHIANDQQSGPKRGKGTPGDQAPHHDANHENYAAEGQRSAAYNGHKSPHYVPGPSDPELVGKVVTINNNTNGMIQVALRGKKEENGTHTPGGTLTFIPGANFVPAEQWAHAKEHPSIATYLKSKIDYSPAPEATPDKVGSFILVEMGGPVDKDSPLAGVEDEDKACEIVGEMFDARVIRKSLDQETRPKVVGALKAQLKKIENPVAKKSANP